MAPADVSVTLVGNHTQKYAHAHTYPVASMVKNKIIVLLVVDEDVKSEYCTGNTSTAHHHDAVNLRKHAII